MTVQFWNSVYFTDDKLKKVIKTWKKEARKMEEQMTRDYWKMLADYLELDWSTKDSTERIIKKVKDILDLVTE